MLKRKHDESMDDGGDPENASTTSNGQSESDDSNCSSGSTDALAPEVASGPSPPKRMKKKVNFKGVSVFYFPRRQGFTCVPSEGGSTLGMSEHHSFTRDFTLSDYTKEQKRIHRAILAEQRRQGKMFPSPLLASSLPPLENEEDVSSGSESDSEYDDYYFLQPLPIRQRRVLLRTAGVKKIDNEEKDECRDIRVSRNVCGCDCKVFCDPATCSCSLAGIQCQVDRLSFPCGCTKDGCSNPAGRIEFNPIRVRTHFIHTLMRLELERKDSQCFEGSPAATTSSLSLKSPVGEIDVVGANGVEESVYPDTSGSQDDSNSCGASTSVGSGKVLKSRLKAKKAEAIDLNMFNSNERGSCRDCQNTDMCNVMMHDVKFSMVTQQQRQQQQQRVITTALGPQPAYSGSQGPQLQHHHHLGISPGMSLLHPPPPPQQQQQPASQHMLLFNDGEEEVYRSENTSSIYFDSDDNSYSELNDTSPDILESRSFSNVGQAGFSGKFHVSPSPMFTCSNSTVGSSNIGTIHSQSPGMTKQPSHSSRSCIQNLQMSSGCGIGLSASSCSNVRMEQQSCCGLVPHPQHQPAAVSNQSHSRPPFMPRTSQFSAGQFVGPAAAMASTSGLLTQTGLMTCTQMDNGLQLESSENTVMLQQGAAPDFQNKFIDTDMIETQACDPPAVYKLDSTLATSNKAYNQSSSSVKGTDYLKQPSHISYSSSRTAGFGSTTATTVGAESGASFQPLQTAQHTSCWSASLTSPTVRECFGLSTSTSESLSSIANQGASQLQISCSSSYQQAQKPCPASVSPESPNSSTITYATMTTTTRDRLAAHCPGISSHVDSRLDLTVSENPASSFSSYRMPGENTDTSSLVGTSQNLLYDLPYTDTSAIESCSDVNAMCTTSDKSGKLLDPLMENESVLVSNTPFSQPLFSQHPPTSSSLSPELSDTSLMYSPDMSSAFMPPLTPAALSSLLTPAASCSSLETCQARSAAPAPCSEPPAAAEVAVTLVHTSLGRPKNSHFNPRRSEIPGNSQASEDIKDMRETNETCLFQSGQSKSNFPNAEVHMELWGTSFDMKDQKEAVSSWVGGDKEEHQSNTHCVEVSSEAPGTESDEAKNFEDVTNSEMSSASSSEVQSAVSSSSSSISSSPTMSEEEKDQRMSQNFGEIIKESIIEMVLV